MIQKTATITCRLALLAIFVCLAIAGAIIGAYYAGGGAG